MFAWQVVILVIGGYTTIHPGNPRSIPCPVNSPLPLYLFLPFQSINIFDQGRY